MTSGPIFSNNENIKVAKPVDTVPDMFVFYGGPKNNKDTQYKEIMIGQRTKSDSGKCIAKFLTVVVKHDSGDIEILPIGNASDGYFTPELIKRVMDETKDVLIHMTELRKKTMSEVYGKDV